MPPRRTGRSVTKNSGRATLKEALPDALRHAVETYRTLAFGPVPEDAKGFQQYQAACKAGLAHIEALLKLADATGTETPVGEQHATDASAMLARAEAAYAAYASETEADEDVKDETNDA
jgi:hypothetical protein